jgi:pimeloyl-ACP methyl ester carboxylesterase
VDAGVGSVQAKPAATDGLNVILLPGGTLPAGLAYGALIEALGSEARCVPKDLEVYAGDEPQPEYSADMEIDGVLRVADEAGFDRFQLVGYSAGGLFALATAVRHPDRVAGLGLVEFAPVRSLDTGPEGDALWREFERLMTLPPEERGRASSSMILKPGTQPPARPAGPPPPWMAKRAAAYEPLMRATWLYPLDLEAVRGYHGPMYVALGSLSHESFERQTCRLAELCPQTEIEVYEGLHHLDPPHRAEPARLSQSLLRTWSRAGATHAG